MIETIFISRSTNSGFRHMVDFDGDLFFLNLKGLDGKSVELDLSVEEMELLVDTVCRRGIRDSTLFDFKKLDTTSVYSFGGNENKITQYLTGRHNFAHIQKWIVLDNYKQIIFFDLENGVDTIIINRDCFINIMGTLVSKFPLPTLGLSMISIPFYNLLGIPTRDIVEVGNAVMYYNRAGITIVNKNLFNSLTSLLKELDNPINTTKLSLSDEDNRKYQQAIYTCVYRSAIDNDDKENRIIFKSPRDITAGPSLFMDGMLETTYVGSIEGGNLYECEFVSMKDRSRVTHNLEDFILVDTDISKPIKRGSASAKIHGMLSNLFGTKS